MKKLETVFRHKLFKTLLAKRKIIKEMVRTIP